MVLPGRSCLTGWELGIHFRNVQECAVAAMNDQLCNSNSNFIDWKEDRHHATKCSCCEDTNCPLDSLEFAINSNYNIYEFRKCSSKPSLSMSPQVQVTYLAHHSTLLLDLLKKDIV